MLKHLISDTFQDNYCYWTFYEKVTSSHKLERETIALDGSYNYHDDIHDIVNGSDGFKVSENLNDDNTCLRKEEMHKQVKYYFNY